MIYSSALEIGKSPMMTLAERLAFISATRKMSKGEEDYMLSWEVVKTERVTTRFQTLAKNGHGFTLIVLITLDSLPIFVDKACIDTRISSISLCKNSISDFIV
ncbi:hypothetical protein GJ496_005900 [Pomphorhynchus laevis]|nr:hypothetical protein GJ496_005900 [Pomphorhynchus laevis]